MNCTLNLKKIVITCIKNRTIALKHKNLISNTIILSTQKGENNKFLKWPKTVL